MRDERVFLLMLFVNLLIAVIYFLWFLQQSLEKKERKSIKRIIAEHICFGLW